MLEPKHMPLDVADALARLLDALPDPASLLAADGETMLEVNAAFARSVGKRPDEMIGTTWSALYPQEAVERRRSFVRAAVEGKLPLAFRDERDGRHFLHQICPVLSAEGNVRWVLCRAEDVTEKHRLRSQVAAASARLEEVLHSISDGFLIIDTGDWTYRYLNPAGARMLGCAPETLVGKRVWTLIPETRDSVFARAFERADRERVKVTYADYFPPLSAWFEGTVYPVEEGLACYFRDITAYKSAERAAAAAQRRLRHIFDRIPAAIGVYAPDGTVLDVNQAPLARGGLSLDEVVGKKVWDVPSFDHSEEAQARVKDAVARAASGEVARFESTVRTQGDQRMDVAVTASPLFDESGRVTEIVGFAVDVTERNRALVALKDSEELFRSIFDQVAVGMCLSSLDGRFLRVNQRFSEIVDRPTGDLMGMRYADLVAPGEQPIDLPDLDRLARGETATLTMERRLSRRDGSTLWAHLTLSVRHAPSGEPIALVGVVEDISARKATEAALLESESKLARAQRLAHMGSWDLDPATGAISWSEELYRITEVEPSPALDLRAAFAARVCPEERARSEAALGDALASGGSFESTRCLRMPDGRTKHVHMITEVVSAADGSIARCRGSVQDITAAKLAEEQLRRSLAEKETLLKEVHHRVKNNLQIISSLLHFQSKKVRAPEDLAAFTDGRNRLLAMILVHERLYGSKQLSSVEFSDYVRALVDGLSGAFESRGRFRTRVIAGTMTLPIELALPSGMILCELLTNVFKYAFPEGRSGSASVTVREEEGRVLLAVDDDGVGFPAGFDPASADSFGWRLVNALVLQLDARLTVRSENGVHVSIAFAAPARE